MGRRLFFDEVFQAFYDYAECGPDALSWPRTTPQAGDLVHTFEGKHPVHRAAIANAIAPMGLALTEAVDDAQEWAEVINQGDCLNCLGTGEVDSGAPQPMGGGFYTVACPYCDGTGKEEEDDEG
jgi:hypothetical protein